MAQNITQTHLPIIKVENVSVSLDDNVILSDVSFDIPQGCFVGVLGPNGAGKSTLLRCIYRYIRPSSGQVLYRETDVWSYSANQYATEVAVVLQHTPQQFRLNVYDVVALGLVPHQSLFASNSISDKEDVKNAITQVGLSHKSVEEFESLSGGEKQRAMIARAIVQKPQLLVLDEPTSHLDVKYQIQIMELAKSLGITVVASFHDLNLASAICDELLLLDKGKLVAQGKPEAVITEQNLSDVFDVCAKVTHHPQHKAPQVTYFYGYVESNVGESQRHED